MSDRLVPQRWNEPPLPFDDAVSTVPRADQDSVLTVLLEFVALIRRNYPIVLATTLGSLAILFVQLRHDHPLYRASAVIRFQDKGRALSGGLAGGASQQLGAPIADPLLTQIQVLQSRAVARSVVEREGLRARTDPPNLPAGWLKDVVIGDPLYHDELELTFGSESAVIRRGTTVVDAPYGVPTQIGGVKLTVARRPGIESVNLSILPLERAVDGLLAGLRGRARERTDIIDITYENSNPDEAQRVANSVADVFQALNAQSAKQESGRRRQFIEGQLRKTELLLAEAQESHNQFRTQKQVYSSQEKFRSQQADLTGIELRRRELQADRGLYQSLLHAIRDPRRSDAAGDRFGALVSAPGIASNPVVAQLYAQLTRLQGTRDSLTTGQWSASKDNPDIKRLDMLIASTESNIAAAVRGQIAGVDARIAALDELQRRSAGQMAVLPTTEAREAGLLAQVETFRREADRLREELQKAQIEEAAEGGQIDLVDPASPPTRPIGSSRAPRVVFALVMGIALGTLIAYVLENYTSVIRRREELERLARVPMLAFVPPLTPHESPGNRLLAWMHPSHVATGNGNGNALVHRRELVTMVDMKSHAAEAFRTLRTNLLFSSAIESIRQVIVTSPGPTEGKSTTAANLAVAFAQQGQRVLLMDCDLRRPRIHQVFGHAQIPGLTNALMGNMSSAEVIHSTDVEGLSVLTAGPTPPNPAELLGGSRMRELLDKLAQSYEMVIIDTPPVLIASDAAILSRHVAGTLLVVRAGKTQTAALRDAMQQLATVGTRVTGTVLNDPDGEVGKFSSYYGSYHRDYYGATPAVQ
jgi:capsular exopolysaccharide synthesis family protein